MKNTFKMLFLGKKDMNCICSSMFYSKKKSVEPLRLGAMKVFFFSWNLDHITKSAVMPNAMQYMMKTLQKSSPEPEDRFPRNLICNIGDSGP